MATKKTAADRRREAGFPEPAKGQVWADMDRRARDHVTGEAREIVIVEVSKGAGIVTVSARGRLTKIGLDRLVPGSTGYRYVRTVEPSHV